MKWFSRLHPVVQALPGSCFTWGVTVLVFFFKEIKKEVLNGDEISA